jgi:hypothetical protein
MNDLSKVVNCSCIDSNRLIDFSVGVKILLFCCLFFVSWLHSHTVLAQSQEWALVDDSNGIKISYKISTCGSDNVSLLLLRIENITPEDISFPFQIDVTDETHGQLTLHYPASIYKSDSSIEGECSKLGVNDLVRFLEVKVENPSIKFARL